jgi:hypothetical protein
MLEKLCFFRSVACFHSAQGTRTVVWRVALLCGLGLQVVWAQATNVFPQSGDVGIGTTSPAFPLDVTGPVRVTGDTMISGDANLATFGYSATYLGGGNWVGSGMQWAFGLTAAYLASLASGTPSVIAAFASNGAVGIGTLGPCANSQAPSNCKLSVAGAIQAQEVVVNSGWSDYVFAPDYRLAPLAEVANYIDEHHHLPDMPSASEVKDKGVSLGDMQAKLLAKIEELTLHMIQNEERNKALEERVNRLQSELSRKGN